MELSSHAQSHTSLPSDQRHVILAEVGANAQTPLWVHRFAVLTAVATVLLIFVGALVTSTGSGLAVPDWPLSFGMVFPPMVGGVLFEHGHRMVAAGVGLLTVALMVMLWRWEARSWVRWLGGVALLAILVQGTLGGMTVLLRLPTAVSVSHACLAQAFLCVLVLIATCTAPAWFRHAGRRVDFAWPSLKILAGTTTGMVYCQLILGALMRHTGAGLAIPDFPLAFGQVFPPFQSSAVVIHFAHRLGALAVTLCLGWTVGRVVLYYRDEPALLRPALVLVGLLLLQLILGALTIWTGRAVLPMTAHVAIGATVLATSFFLTVRVVRLIVSGTQGHSGEQLKGSQA